MTNVQNSETAVSSTKRGSAKGSRDGKGKDSRASADHKETPKGTEPPDISLMSEDKVEDSTQDSTDDKGKGNESQSDEQGRNDSENLSHILEGIEEDVPSVSSEKGDTKSLEGVKSLSMCTDKGMVEDVQTPSASLNSQTSASLDYETSTYASESAQSVDTDTLTVCNEQELYDSPNGSQTKGENTPVKQEGNTQRRIPKRENFAIKSSPKKDDDYEDEEEASDLDQLDNSQIYVDLDNADCQFDLYKSFKRTGKTRKLDDYEEKIIERDPTRFFGSSACGIGNILQLELAKLSRERRWIWLLARYEAFCLGLQVNGINLSKIRTGRAKGSRCQLVEYINKERARIFGNDTFFQTGETLMNIPPFANFLRREELLFFGIAKTPYEVVSVDEFKPEPDSGEPYKVVHTIVLDGTESLREDMGLRFVMYFTFDNQENSKYVNAHVPLQKSWIHEVPIRIVRSYNSHSRFSPIWGYRYDGLYRIINVFSDNNHEGTRVWVYIFSACNTKLKPPRHKLTHDTILKFKVVKERSLRGILYKHTLTHYKLQRHIKNRRADDVKPVDVIFKGKRLFTLGIPHFVKIKNKAPIPVNLAAIYYHIKQICESGGIANEWLEGPASEYEKGKDSEIWWAKGGFLPLKLVLERVERKDRLDIEVTKGGFKEKVVSKKTHYIKSIAVNSEMAKIAARPFFPQNDSTSIWTKIELVEPHPNTWNPYKDVSAGSEVHPIPVENNVDQDLPPMSFTYIRNNVFFSRLPNFNLEPVCAGCVPQNFRPEVCHKITVSGFCKGFVDPEGKVYCEGINKRYLSAIRSRASCSDNCPCANTCRNRLPDGIQIPVKLVKAAQLGWALHTRVPLRKGTFIMQYVGEIICRSEMAAREHHYDKLGQFNYCMESVEMEKQSDDWQMPCIDSMVLGNIARFLNHSCEPNVEVITVWKGDDFPSIAVYALCDIAAGDALTYCYGNSYRSIPCLCGTKSCRGFIGSVV